MGREIRRVPPNWQHPKVTKYNPWKRREETNFQPKYNQNYDEAVKEWNDGIVLWNQGNHPIQIEHKNKIESGNLYKLGKGDKADVDCTNRMNNPNYYSPSEGYNYWNYHGNPPEEDYYLPYTESEATWYQLYETVSEGTPVSPPFETKEKLADYLADNGDFWDQQRRKDGDSVMDCRPWGKEQAYKFVLGDGWAPSLVFNGAKIVSGVEYVTSQQSEAPNE